MLKKAAALLVSLAMAAVSLSGCGARALPEADPAQSVEESAVETPASGDTRSSPEAEMTETDAPDQTEPAEEAVEEDFGDHVWEFDSPENHNMNGELLNALHTALEGTQIYSAVTVRDGVIVDEFYQEGYDDASVFRFNSCSKSFTSALIGIAIDEGLIEGVDIPISDYFELEDDNKAGITIRHLLEHTSGMEWYEFGGSAASFWGMNNADNWVDYVLERPMTSSPGSVFTYSTGGTHLLAAILEQAAEETMLKYAQRHIFSPLGMKSVHWRIDPQGIPDGGNGIEMTARDAAKFGQLFLNNGNWDGRQLVPEEWVAESTDVQVARSGNYGSYGYQWWIRQFAGYDAYYAMGAMGQFIFVAPDLDLVTVITSMSDDTADPYVYISDYILAACS